MSEPVHRTRLPSETLDEWTARLKATPCTWRDVEVERYAAYDFPEPDIPWEEVCDLHMELDTGDRPCEAYRCKICGLNTGDKWTPTCPNTSSTSIEHAVWEALNE